MRYSNAVHVYGMIVVCLSVDHGCIVAKRYVVRDFFARVISSVPRPTAYKILGDVVQEKHFEIWG